MSSSARVPLEPRRLFAREIDSAAAAASAKRKNDEATPLCESCVACGTPTTSPTKRNNNGARRLPLCGVNMCMLPPPSAESSPEPPPLPLPVDTNYALRVHFTGERQLKWRVLVRSSTGGAPTLRTVDSVTGQTFVFN